jgi:hypothetical protein
VTLRSIMVALLRLLVMLAILLAIATALRSPSPGREDDARRVRMLLTPPHADYDAA